jgi:transcriptional regulator with XRE-family HTH domain
MPVGLGEKIRCIRTRLRKSQGEFAEILGSQQNSVSRYEKDKVEPGLGVLWKLHGLAERDEKEAFVIEIRRQIGIALLGQEATVEVSTEDLSRILTVMAELQEWQSLIAAGRGDRAALLWATQQLKEDKHIDKSLIEILTLWVERRQQKGAASILRATAAFLRERLEENSAQHGKPLQHVGSRTTKD